MSEARPTGEAGSIEIWGRRSSFNVQKVLWLADELGLGYNHVELGGRFGGLDQPDFRTLNPHAKVPVIRDGELVVWESHSILRYLAACYSDGRLWSSSPSVRSHVDRWLDWAATRLQPDFMALFWGYYRQPAPERDMTAVNEAREACARNYAVLDAELSSRPYLAGEAFSLADVTAGASLFRYFGMGLDVPRPQHVVAWYERLQKMESYRRQIMEPFDELHGRASY